MFLLDTDTLTHLHANHRRTVQNFQACSDPVIGITIVTRIEVLRGRFESLLKADTTEEFLRAQAQLIDADKRIEKMLTVGFDRASLDHFQKMRYAKGLKKIGRTDLLIASIALGAHATLVTRNTKDFKLVPGLNIANWVD